MKRFYASGLKFSCKRCSACCRYDAGYVFLSENDLNKLLAVQEMDRKNFIAAFCRWITDWDGKKCLSLKERTNKDCIFWDNGCKVYRVRPLQCRAFPFWESIVATAESWKIAASGCTGINSGKLYTAEEIDYFLERRSLEPIIYLSDRKSGHDRQGENK